MTSHHLRHPEADPTPVTIEASDALDAAGALILAAIDNRRQATLRRNGGPSQAAHRRWLRDTAAVYDSAAARIQAAADRRFDR